MTVTYVPETAADSSNGFNVELTAFSGPLEHFFMPDAEKIYQRMKELYRF